MNPDGTQDGPGQATDPAFALPPSRDFDGGLLRRWSYMLTSADALAVLRLAKPWPRWQSWGLGGLALAWGALVAVLPPDLVGAWGSTRFVITLTSAPVLCALGFLVGRDLWRCRQARRWLPQARPGVLEEWTDCIAVTRLDAVEEDYLSPELIGAVGLTRRHLLVFGPGAPLVVPLTAFANRAEAVEIASHLTALAKGPYYFDP